MNTFYPNKPSFAKPTNTTPPTREEWLGIVWKKVNKVVFQLQKRIYKATKAGQKRKAKKLCKLLMRSQSAALVNVRKVTQDNQGKKTAGVDKIKVLKPKERTELVNELLRLAKGNWKKYFTKPILRFFIPKKNGQMRPLGVPTIKDRVVQGIVKTSCEPIFEAKFESGSYGFRPAHSAHDAIEHIFKALNKSEKWILDADIKGCFDNISHDFVLSQLDSVNESERNMIKQWLKAGIMDKVVFSQSEIGTPQGGIISPLLAHIALDGMKEYLFNELRKNHSSGKRDSVINGSALSVIRYADDFVIIHKDKEVIEESRELLNSWLGIRGLELSPEKTRIVHSTEGFNFLGFNCEHYDTSDSKGWYRVQDKKNNKRSCQSKLLIKPSKESVKEHSEAISEAIDKMKSWRQEEVISKLNPMIIGWANYFRGSVAKKTFAKLDHIMWIKLRTWVKRRKGRKSLNQALESNYHQIGTRRWCFATFKEGKPDKILKKYSDVAIKRHVQVKSGKSFYDGDTMYWAQRLSKGYGDISPSKAKLLKEQKGKCVYCGSLFKEDDLMESHHIRFKSQGGKDSYNNLALIHKHCHDQYHAEEIKMKRRNGKLKGESKKTDGIKFSKESVEKVLGKKYIEENTLNDLLVLCQQRKYSGGGAV
jgi:RNA-directed DNA polymerase